MAIDYVVDLTRIGQVEQAGILRRVRVLMTNGTAYRADFVVVQSDGDPREWVLENVNINALWAGAESIDKGAYLAALYRQIMVEDYFYNIMISVASGVPAGETPEDKLDTLIADGIAAINLIPEQGQLFGMWRVMMGTYNPSTIDEKRMLVRDIFQFFLTGLLAGGIKR